MVCDSPSIDEADSQKIDADKPLQLEYGFRMDDVKGVQNLTSKPGYNSFLLYPNPEYKPFDEEIKYYKSDYLTINVIFNQFSLFIYLIKLYFFCRVLIWIVLVRNLMWLFRLVISIVM